MTDLLTPDRRGTAGQSKRQADQRPGSVVLSALHAAIWAAGVGLIAITVVVLLAWTTERRSGADAASALRIASDVWLLANGAPLRISGTPFALVPFGLTVLPAYLLIRAGESLARALGVSSLSAAARPTGALAVAYGVLAVVVSGAAATPQVQVAPLRAFAAATGLAAVCGGIGVARGAGLWPELWALLPGSVRAAVRGGAVAVLVMVAGGAVVAGVALALSAGEAGRVLSGLGVGTVGTVALLLLSLAYVPTAVVYSAAFITGTGFAVGAGTTVSPFDVRLGPVPALPLLAALPSGPVASWQVALIAVPVAGGGLAGALLGRRHRGVSLRWLLPTAAATGPVAGVLLGLLCLLTAGAAGSGRLATVGPSSWRVGLVLAVEVAPAALLAAWWVGRREPADDEEADA